MAQWPCLLLRSFDQLQSGQPTAPDPYSVPFGRHSNLFFGSMLLGYVGAERPSVSEVKVKITAIAAIKSHKRMPLKRQTN